MKKFFAVAALILGIFVAQISQVQAYEDPYENDANFAYVYILQGARMYLDLTSVDVQEYDPPHYQIAGRFVLFNPDSASVDEYYVEMRFNYSTKETFVRDDNGQWRLSRGTLSDSSNATSRARARANALFRAAYRMNFYN